MGITGIYRSAECINLMFPCHGNNVVHWGPKAVQPAIYPWKKNSIVRLSFSSTGFTDTNSAFDA